VFEQAGVSKDQRVRLVSSQLLDDSWEIVDVPGTSGAIEPELHELTIVQRELVQLSGIVTIVFGGIRVTWLVTIPWREVHAEFQSILARGSGDFAYDVALATSPWTLLDAVVGLFGRPQAETVVMLCDHYDILDAGRLDGAHPLFRVKLCRIEDLRISGSVTPFSVLKCIWPEVNDRANLEILPFDLLRRRLHVDKILSGDRKAICQRSEHRQQRPTPSAGKL